MATLTQIRGKANTKLTAFWNALQIKQEAYFLKHDKFFQLLVTNPVVDGADTTFEVIHPSDEKHLVDVDFSFPDTIPFQIEVSEWVGRTKGYIVTVTVELLNGTKYQRSRTAVPIVQKEVLDLEDRENPVVITPKAITGWTEEGSNWYELINE